MDGVLAQMRARAVRGFAARFQAQPEAAFVRGDDLQSRRLADDGQIRAEPAGRQGARAGLRVFLVHQARENNFRRRGAAALPGQADQGREHGGDGAFGVARAAPMNSAVNKRGTSCSSDDCVTVSR